MQISLRFSCLWLLCETISSDRGSDRSSDINILDMVVQVAPTQDAPKLQYDNLYWATVATMPNADKFQLHIYAALAEQEVEFISLRTKQALAPLKGTGKFGGNRGNIDIANAAARKGADDHAAKVMDTILPLKEAGRTLQQIADTLNKSGVKTARGGQWYPSTVSNILKRL